MEGIASFEQKTSETFNGPDRLNRIIIVNRAKSRRLDLRADKYPKFPSNELVTSKYTILNFLPKNLFEQFRRLANFYFLIIALLQAVSPSSPVGPSTSLIPLIFVVSTTAIKQAYEDHLRHKLDAEINKRLVLVLRDKKIVRIESRHIQVGDIVYITNNEELPCDAILLASSCDDRCHVTTANLDGETNLKLRNCFQIRHQIGDIDKIDDSIFILECDQPNATLYEFNGFLRHPKDEETANQLLDSWSPSLSSTSTSQPSPTGGQQQATSNDSRRASSWSCSSMAPPTGSSGLGQPASRLPSSGASSMGNRLSNMLKSLKSLKDLGHWRSSTPSNPAVESIVHGQQTRATDNNWTSGGMAIGPNDCIEVGLDPSNLLLRASRLKNTAYIYCLAIYTGRDTKVAHNSRLKPNKFSSIEHTVNKFLVVCFLLLLVFATASTILFEPLSVWYLEGISMESERYDLLFLSHFLIFNYLVPISLYVTLEFVKFVGTLAVVNDKELRVLVQNGNNTEGGTTSDLISSSSPANQLGSSSPISGDGSIVGQGLQKTINIKQTNNSNPMQKTSINKSYSGSEKIHSISGGHHPKMMWEKPKCNSSDLNEELGQVQVLFSDKTGTLTENQMIFRACTAYGSLYRSTKKQRLYYQPPDVEPIPIPPIIARLRRTTTNRQALLSPLTPVSPLLAKTSKSKSKQNQRRSPTATQSTGSSSGLSAQMPPVKKLQQIKDVSANERLVDFFTCLILCSTVHLNETQKLEDCLPYKCSNQYDYHSASPDEESLVSAAHKFGVTMCKSNDRECYIIIKNNSSIISNNSNNNNNNNNHNHNNGTGIVGNVANSNTGSATTSTIKTSSPTRALIPNEEPTQQPLAPSNYIVKRYERLCTFEFNSIRKRMSVLYRDSETQRIYMATKGSEEMLDCIKLSGLDAETEHTVNVTLAHFEAFAKSGLRTLLVAKKQLHQMELERIQHELKNAMLTMGTGRAQRMQLVHQKAETELTLIGATAVEDCLQDGVPETIADLKTAGIKVWLLTGDKVETATSVAYLCKLLDHDMIQFQLVRQQDSQSCGRLLKQYRQQVDLLKSKAGAQLNEASSGNRSGRISGGGANSNTTAPFVPVQTGGLDGTQVATALKVNKDNNTNSGGKVNYGSVPSPSAWNQSIMSMNLEAKFLERHRYLQARAQQAAESAYKFALIADGRSLYYAMKNHRELLASLCENCTSVLGCRLSPMQKAEIVRMIKMTPDAPVTAAIGDGANDVSMIQEAHVGIGVSGKEGRQAVNSSDFAIGRFRLLRRLLFVHGQLFYVRSARTINYFFYKNMIFILPQFIYGFYNGFSAHTIYSPMMLIGYNVFFTSLPIFAYGLTERHIPVKLLENFPRLYRIIRNNSLMSTNIFLMSLALATLQAALIFYSMYHVWGSHTPFLESGRMSGIDGYSTILYFVIIFLVSAQLLLVTRQRALWFNLTIIFSLISLPCVLYLHSLINWGALNLENTASGQFPVFAKSYMFWLAIFVLTSLGIIPAMIVSILETTDYYREINDCLMQ